MFTLPRLTLPNNKKISLTRTTLIKMSMRIALIIIVTALMSYWHIMSHLEWATVNQLEKYILERGQRESHLFKLAQDNHILLKQEFIERLKELGHQDPKEQFEQLFVKWSDGTTRPRPKDQAPEQYDTFHNPGTYIDDQVEINADIRRRVIVSYELMKTYGPAWRNRFVNTYVCMPENISVDYWPKEPWSIKAQADIDIPKEEYFYISTPKNNPTRSPAWTGLYFDEVAKDWMVSLETPIDDEQGRHIVTLGHDIVLNELMERTINDRLKGTYNLLFRQDGRLIVDPNKITAIQKKAGQFFIQDSDDLHLKHIFKLVTQAKNHHPVIKNKDDQEYLAVTKIEGPEWHLVTVYPQSLLTTSAYQAAYFIFFLGIVSLIIEIILLFLVLHKQIAQPLQKFVQATQQIAQGHFDKQTVNNLPISRNDEIGELASSFHHMVNELRISFTDLEIKNKELLRLDQLKNEFLANTSHELRTPLHGMIGLACSLVDGVGGELPDLAKTHLMMIAKSGQRLAGLVNDILDFSKLRHQKLELQLQPIGIYETIELVFALSQPLLANKKNLQLVNLVDQHVSPVLADENRLQQIFYNLIGNAIKFTVEGKIEISAQVKDQRLHITVADSGIGIPADKLDCIFESFEQVDGSIAKEHGGTGLGLSITQQLIKLHGGMIWVESQLAQGSQFHFTLPLAQEPVIHSLQTTKNTSPLFIFNEQSIHLAPSKEMNSALEINSTLTVLIVDDEPINLQVLHNYLSPQNYHIIHSLSGEETLAQIEIGEWKPDAILLDVMMPKLTGYEVLRQLRETWGPDELPILLLTAKNQLEDLVTGFIHGANDYLMKPIAKEELLARLKTHLHIKELQIEALQTAQKNEAQLRQILEAIPIGIKVLEASGKPYFVNQHGQKLPTTYDSFYLRGTYQKYPVEEIPVVQALQGQKNWVDNIDVHQGDEVIPLEIWGTPIFDAEHKVNHAIAVFQDISDRLKKEKAEREREATEAVNQMMIASLKYAKTIQSSLLPHPEQIKAILPHHFFLWSPRDIVGGDMIYAESFPIGILIVVLDCTGHGVPGALMTMVASTCLRRITREEACFNPAEILKRLNYLVKTSLQQDTPQATSDDGLDAAVCLVRAQHLIFAGAKLPLYYIEEGQLKIIKGNKKSLGYKKADVKFNFTNHVLLIQSGLRFYLSTDGLIDQLGGERRLPFGKKRFGQVLLDSYSLSFEEQAEKLLDVFQTYHENDERQDDVTVVGFEVS